MKVVKREELGSRPNLSGLVRGARVYCRRLLATLRIRIPRYLRAWKGGELKVGVVRRSADLLLHSNKLFQLVEAEAEFVSDGSRIRQE